MIKWLKRLLRPGKSRRNSLNRGVPRRLTGWERSQLELRVLFARNEIKGPMSWADSLNSLAAIAA